MLHCLQCCIVTMLAMLRTFENYANTATLPTLQTLQHCNIERIIFYTSAFSLHQQASYTHHLPHSF
jgi:polyferredoxin